MRVIAGILLIVTTILLPAAMFGEEEQKPVQITLYPSLEARPALKYQLLPPFLERRPGNAAVWWNRIPARREFFMEFDKEYDKSPGKIHTWLKIPLGNPDEKEYREKDLSKVIHLLKAGPVYFDMERAARFESCDWQLPIREGNVFEIDISEVQQCREFARLLSCKARLEIAEGKFDDAIRTLQTLYALSRHVAQGHTAIHTLVGRTLAGISCEQTQQLIQQPHAPNLYWALSTLPRPLIDFRLGEEIEASLLYLQYPELRNLDKKILSAHQWQLLLESIVENIMDCATPDIRSKYDNLTVKSVLDDGYPRAKRYLIDHGHRPKEVEAMSRAQVVLLYSVQLYDELSGNHFKWLLLPFNEGISGLEQNDRHMEESFAAKCEIIPLAEIFVAGTGIMFKNAEILSEWQIAVLRIFEAMRLYAAAHDGKWPDRLSDITEVPIPLNPCDGKPFLYERQGDKAVLNSEKGPTNVPWRYEITLMQSKKGPKPSP